MNNIKTQPYSFVSNIKVKFAVISLALWLCALFSWIYFCPKYLPDAEYLLFSSFDSRPVNTAGKSELVIEPWHRFTKGVIWDSEGGYEGSAGIKLVANGNESSFLEWILANPRSYSYLEFRGKMRSESIVMGENEWDTARLLVYFTGKEGKGRWDYPHAAGRLFGTSSWKEFVKIFPVPDFAVTAHVVIQNSGKSGTIWCDDISLRPAIINPSYFLYKNILIVSGIALCIVLIVTSNLWRKGGQLLLILLVTIILGVIASNNYFEMLAGNHHINIYVVKKLGHLFLFILLGLVSTRWIGARLETPGRPSLLLLYPFLIFGGLVLFAAITEFVQFLTIDRDPSIIDLLIDMVGVILGISIAYKIKKVKRRDGKKASL